MTPDSAGVWVNYDSVEASKKHTETLGAPQLTTYSPRDKPWDVHRGQCDDVTGIYASSREFQRYAARMSVCSTILHFGGTYPTEHWPELTLG